MAQQARPQQRERQAIAIAPRHIKPANFNGTDTTWRVLNDLYPAAETPEIILALLDYCSVRRLDPFKRPVHVVPMYNARLRRKVQVVMQGINEVEITAARSQKWAGMDPPIWGPAIDKTFTGSFENDDGTTTQQTVKMNYPLWCRLTVYRLVGGEKRAFSEELFWIESYGRAGFRSEIPNARWQQAPRQMLHKCTKAAVLRAAFPEDVTEYVAEEMEGREIEHGGITIDGVVDQTGETIRREQPRTTTGTASTQGDNLETESDTGRFLKTLRERLAAATSLTEVVELAGKPSVRKALREAPSLIVAQINDMLKAGHDRFEEPPAQDGEEPPPHDGSYDGDGGGMTGQDLERLDAERLADALADVEGMDLVALQSCETNAAWRAKVRQLSPLDVETVNEAIVARIAKLKAEGTKQ